MEGYHTPENYSVRADEIAEFVKNIKIKEHQPVVFHNTEIQVLFLNKSEVENDSDAFYSTSTEINGYDIYILRSLSQEQKKQRLFHELIEIDLLTGGYSADQSHPIAFAEEERIFGKR